MKAESQACASKHSFNTNNIDAPNIATMTCNNNELPTNICGVNIETSELYCREGCQLIYILQKNEQSDMRNPIKTNPPWKPQINVTPPANLKKDTACPVDPRCQDGMRGTKWFSAWELPLLGCRNTPACGQ